LKILWLSPIAIESAIARFSELVLRELWDAGCEIAVFSAHADPPPTRLRPFLTQWQLPGPWSEDLFDQFDAVIVNFGDHFPNHGGALDALKAERLIGIFHDADMTNFGNGAWAFGKDHLISLEGSGATGNMVTGQLAAHCCGAVSHAPFYRPVISSCDGPVATIPLAWSLPPGARTGPVEKERTSAPDTVRIVTFGNINANKCADRVIEAVAGSDVLRGAVNYRLVGAISSEQRAKLSDQAVAAGIDLDIVGPVDEAALHGELRNADIIMCLRHPVLEGASASAVEAMLHGHAVVVSDAGFYASLPDDVVAKVSSDTKPMSIRKTLDALVLNPKDREALGERARAYAEDTFAPKRYADALLDLIEDVRVTSAYAPTIKRLAERLAAMGLAGHTSLLEPVLTALEKTAPVRRRHDEAEQGLPETVQKAGAQ
jgi:glycosyltransferase involved in cell wall biosynthesis